MSEENVLIEDVTSIPNTRAFFQLPCTVSVRIRNKTAHPILIEEVGCELEVDQGFDSFVPSVAPFIQLAPSHLSLPISIEFIADVSLKQFSNFYKITLKYSNSERTRMRLDLKGKYFTFYPSGSGSKQLFISHKEPEDSDLARNLAHLLGKIGFKGYLSEDDHRPGLRLWEEKIPMSIRTSVGLVLLWTANASANSVNLLREIEMAKEAGIYLFPALEPGTDIPAALPKEVEYYRFSSCISSKELRSITISIDATYRTTDLGEVNMP